MKEQHVIHVLESLEYKVCYIIQTQGYTEFLSIKKHFEWVWW